MRAGNVIRFRVMISIVMFVFLIPSIFSIVLVNSSLDEEYYSFFLPIPISGDHRITRDLYIDNDDWVIASSIILGRTDTHEYDSVFVFHLKKGLVGSLVAVDAYSVAVSTRKNLLLVGGKGYLRAYRLDSLKELWEENLGISVRKIEFSPDKSLVALVGDKGGYVYVYVMSIDDRKVLGYRKIYEEVKVLRWSPDSDKLLVLTEGYGYVIDRNGETIWSASEAPLSIDGKWSSTGKYFGVVSRKGTVTLYSGEGKKLWSMSGCSAIAFIGDDLVLLGYRKSIRAVSVASGEIKWRIDNLKFLEYIKTAESLGDTAIFISSSGEMVIVDKNGEKKYPSMPAVLFKAVKVSRGAYVVSSYSLDTLIVSLDGNIVTRLHLLIGNNRAMVYTGNTMYITTYSLNNTHYVYKISLENGQLTVKELKSNEKNVVLFVDDNRYFIRSLDGLKYVVNGKELTTISVPQPYLQKVVLSPDKKYFLLIPAGIVYSLETGEKILSIGKANKYVWSPDSRLMVRLYGYYIGVYDLIEQKRLYGSDMGELGKTRTASWSSDSKYLAVVRERGVEIYKVESDTVEKIHALMFSTDPIAAFWTSEGLLAVLQYNETTGEYFIEFYDTQSWKPVSNLKLGKEPILSIKQVSEDIVAYLTRLAKGEDKYTIGIVLIDLGKKQVITIDTNIHTESKHILKLYPLSSTTFVVYEEKKGTVLIVSNTQPIQKIILGKIPVLTTTTTTTITATTTTTTTSPAKTSTTTQKTTSTTTKTTTTNSTVPNTTKTPLQTSQAPIGTQLLAIIAVAIIIIVITTIVLKKK